MQARSALAVLIIAVAVSVAVMWSGVSNRSFAVTAWSAAAFAIVAVLAGWRVNRAVSSEAAGDAVESRLEALRSSGQVTAVVYAWGAAAMAAMYTLTGLHWQHGLQYAAGMLLFAAVIYGWTRLARPDGPMATPAWLRRASRLNLLHGAVAAIAVAIFLASGKLWVDRPDWAANIVFVAGGFSIVTLCAMAALTQARLDKRT